MSGDGQCSVEPTADQQKPKNLIRSQYKDVMVKVDEDVYYLDRLQLALKSGYFETLFIEDYRDKNLELIEIPLMDTDTFSEVVDIMYGQKLKTVVNSDNFVSLLMAMDYLQMDIDAETYKMLVQKQLPSNSLSPLNLDVFKLYKFIAQDSTYEYLLPVVFQYLSYEFENIQEHDEFLSISFGHLRRIIAQGDRYSFISNQHQEKHEFSRICARWICHDIENRLPFAIDLVNAAKFRFHLSNRISCKDASIKLPVIDEHTNQDVVSRFFYKLLEYNGEILCSVPDPSEPSPYEVEEKNEFEFDHTNIRYDDNRNNFFCCRDPKLETFLNNGYFYDITVKVGEKIYQLHRSPLKSTSAYFETIFSAELSEAAAQCEGIPSLPDKDRVYVIDNIESITFDIIIQHVYLGKVEFTPDFICRLFKAVHILKIDDLLTACCSWMKTNCDDICPKDVIEMLNFTYENVEYKDLNRHFLSKYIVDSWPELDNLPQFADLFDAITLPTDAGSNEKVNFLNKTDQDTFKLIINRIYFDKVELKVDNIVRVLKASETFKMEKLTEECVRWLTDFPKKITFDDSVELLSFAGRNTKYTDAINSAYLIDHMLKWPRIDYAIFSSISFDSLENMLMSPYFHFDDASNIIDICAEWVVQDAKNRFRLIPQIALAISRNRRVDCDDYSIADPSDFSECSPDLVKEKLWKILSATSVLPPEAFCEDDAKKPKTDMPVFIQSKKDKSFRILNANGDEIASFFLCEYSADYSFSFYHTRYPMSATRIDNNLFLLCSFYKNVYFHVYNLTLKKLFSLAWDWRIGKKSQLKPVKYVLLNCRNKIYCGIADGAVLEYSFKMNRWILFSQPDAEQKNVCFTSDGNQLYRIFMTSQTDTTINYTMECYNFERNSWVSSPNLPALAYSSESHRSDEKSEEVEKIFFLENYGFAAIIKQKCILLDRRTHTWRNISMPYNYHYLPEEFLVIAQNESNEMLCVMNNKLYKFSESNERWELKKEWPMFIQSSVYFIQPTEIFPYGNIIAVHT